MKSIIIKGAYKDGSFALKKMISKGEGTIEDNEFETVKQVLKMSRKREGDSGFPYSFPITF